MEQLVEESTIRRKSFQFALNIITLYRGMTDQNEFVLSKQVLRSGTSIGANVEEAVSAMSRRDFLAKMTIALKEARETYYWIRLIDESQIVSVEVSAYLSKSNEIIRILAAIVKTTSENLEHARKTSKSNSEL